MGQNSPHKDVLQPLHEVEEKVNEKIKELKDAAAATNEEFKEFDENDLAPMKKIVLNEQIDKAKENMIEYAEEIKTDPARLKINETELHKTLISAIIAGGGTEADLPIYLEALGMKPAKNATELFEFDDDYEVDEEDMLEVTHNKEADPQTGLNSRVTSVFYDYQKDLKNITTRDEFRSVLLAKIPKALELLDRKYLPAKEQTTLSQIEPGKNMGENIKEMISFKPSEQTELDVFYNAIFGGAIDEKALLDGNGRLNKITARELFSQKIEQICSEFDESQAGQYQKMIEVPEWGTADSNQKMSDLLDAIPEDFYGSSFAKKYEKYAEDSINLYKKAPKGFQEWLGERPKPSGIGGIVDTIQLLFTQAGLGKLLKDFFGADSWIGRLLGVSDEEEQKMEDAEKLKMKEAGIKNPAAWEYKKDIAKLEDLQANPNWENVSIKNITKENVGTFPDEVDAIKSILDSTEPTMNLARNKDFTLDTLKKLDEMKESLILIPDKELFTLKGDMDKKEYTITESGIAEASVMAETLDANTTDVDVLGDYADKFSLKKELSDDAFTDLSDKRFATLQPSLQDLLTLDSKLWGSYKITDIDMEHFLDNMAGNMGWVRTGGFRNVKDAFKESGNSFEVRQGMLSGNTEYKTVEEFFQKLK